jgi:hypothetical protein
VATQPNYDDGPSIVEHVFKAAVAGAQEKYGYILDIKLAKDILFEMLKVWNGSHETFHNTKSGILDDKLYPGEPRSPYTSFLIRYFKALPRKSKSRPTPSKAPNSMVSPSDWIEFEKSDEWSVWVCERTHEIHIFHNPTMSHSESLYNSRGFELGSVVVGGLPCQNKWLPKLHKDKCFEATYRILSGR